VPLPSGQLLAAPFRRPKRASMRCGGLSRPLIRRSRAQPISNSDRYEQHSPAGPNVWEPSRDNKASKGGLAALMEGRLLSVGCSTGNTARAVPLGPTLMASMSQWGSGGWPRSAQIQTDALPRDAGAGASSRPARGRVHGDVSEERSVPDLNRPELFARTPLAFCRHTVVTYNPLTRDWR
jgi:hypothetical protein